MRPPDAEAHDEQIKDILLKSGIITPLDVTRADEHRASRSVPYVTFFITTNVAPKSVIGDAAAAFFELPYIDLTTLTPDRFSVPKIPANDAREYRAVLVSETDTSATIATDSPEQKKITGIMEKIFSEKKITLAYALPSDIDAALKAYDLEFSTRFADELKNSERALIDITDRIITDALALGASDIHFEPQEEGSDIIIRYRVDGLMQGAGNIPLEHYEAITNRIKLQARLHIDDRYALQDGAFRLHYQNQIVDIRVSVIPTVSGEKLNLHLLAEPVPPYTIQRIGLSESDINHISTTLEKPIGMVVVAGPTGAGKTSTLYSMLKMLNRPEVHITSIEDPVEYILSGTNQIQVNSEKNITFAAGLRSLLRQDPDVILVGEIRDADTASIAVSAALSGHLLLTSIHAVDTAAAIPRLLEMGVEPFLLSSTLELIIAQRLVRQLCPDCRIAKNITPEEIKTLYPSAIPFFSDQPVTLYYPGGCDSCRHTGYRGRIGIFELLFMNRNLQELILSRPPLHQLWDEAQRQRVRTMFADGVEKALSGITTLDEVIRVAPPHAQN